MRVTIREIARLANVSRGTVDKVLNNRPGVKKETREKVLQIIKDLNYQPNIIGKALVQNSHPYKIEVILTPDYNPYIQETLKGIQHAIDEYEPFGLEVSVKMLPTLDPEEEIKILSELDPESCSGIAIFPLNDPRIWERINQLSALNIPVVTFNSRVEEIHSICHIGQDHYKSGRTVAGLLARSLAPDAKIGVIVGSYTMSCHHERLHGFRDKLKESFPDITIVAEQPNQDRSDEAFRLTKEYLQQYPALSGIYITGGGVQGVGQALDLHKKDNFHVICHDLTPDSRELLKKGVVDFAISQSSFKQGYETIKIFFEYYFRKQMPTSSIIEMPINIFTDELV